MSIARRRILDAIGRALTLFALLIPCDAVADWTGPSVIVDAPTGGGAGEIGIGRGDVAAYDETPRPLLVADDGTLVLCDRVNQRIVVLRADGSVRNTFGPQQLSSAEAQGWLRGEAILFGTSVLTKTGDVLQRYALDGTLLATARKVAGSIAGLTPDGNIVLRESGPLFRLFDASLVPQSAQASEPALLGAFTTSHRPRIVRDVATGESSIVSDLELTAGGQTTTLEGLAGSVLGVVIGRDGSIYVSSEATDPSKTVVREYPDGTRQTIELPHAVVVDFAPTGSHRVTLALPATEFPAFEQLTADGNFESTPTVVVGDVSVDRDGHVYVYRYDRTRFRILKWTHQ